VDVIPVGPSPVVESQAKDEGLQTELGGLEDGSRRIARTGQIPHGFVLQARNVERREVSRGEEACDLDGVCPVVLHVVAGFFRDLGQRDDPVVAPLAGEAPEKDVSVRGGFVGEDEIEGLGVGSPVGLFMSARWVPMDPRRCGGSVPSAST